MKYKKMIPYLLFVIASYYLFPMVIKDTGMGMLVLLLILPFISLVTSFLYGLKNTFHPLFPLLIMVVYVPSIFLYYNSSAMIYVFIYGVLSIFGMFIGFQISKK